MQHLAGFREVLPSIRVALAPGGSDTPRRRKRTEENSRGAVYVDDDVFFCGRDLRLRVQFDEALADGEDGGLGTVVHLQLVEDVPDVIFDGLFAEI